MVGNGAEILDWSGCCQGGWGGWGQGRDGPCYGIGQLREAGALGRAGIPRSLLFLLAGFAAGSGSGFEGRLAWAGGQGFVERP
jgi:hypothetical protein